MVHKCLAAGIIGMRLIRVAIDLATDYRALDRLAGSDVGCMVRIVARSVQVSESLELLAIRVAVTARRWAVRIVSI
jgi:Lon protease-like protein